MQNPSFAFISIVKYPQQGHLIILYSFHLYNTNTSILIYYIKFVRELNQEKFKNCKKVVKIKKERARNGLKF